MKSKEIVYFQPEGIKPKYCEAGVVMENDPDHIWFLAEPCKILKSEVKIIPKEFVHFDKKTNCYLVIKDPAKEKIAYKMTAVEFLLDNIYLLNSTNWKDIVKKAKATEKNQMMDFASKVLDKAECSFTGMVVVDKSLQDTYDEIYGTGNI